jgi:hypothetical protein
MRVNSRPTNLDRHAAECRICSHEHREEIERDFINWRSPASIAKQYGLRNRSTIYRHAHALGLFSKRQRNVRAALEKIIERAGEVEVNASAIVSAVAAYSRINAAGQWVERSERIDLNQLFARMTALDPWACSWQGFKSKTGEIASQSATGLGFQRGLTTLIDSRLYGLEQRVCQLEHEASSENNDRGAMDRMLEHHNQVIRLDGIAKP